MTRGTFPGMNIPGTCDGAVTAGLGVTLGADGYQQVAAIGGRVDAIPTIDGADGETATFAVTGIVSAVSGAAFARGARLMADAAAKFIPYVAGADRYVAGIAHSSVTGADAQFEIQLTPGGIV